eukprot:180710-Amorphochlora_amoeboformis.AAC.1
MNTVKSHMSSRVTAQSAQGQKGRAFSRIPPLFQGIRGHLRGRGCRDTAVGSTLEIQTPAATRSVEVYRDPVGIC